MSPTARDAYLQQARIARLVTLRSDGSPTIHPVWFKWDGATAAVFTSRGSEKVRRLRDDARVALSVANETSEPEWWVTIEGTATIEEDGGFALAEELLPRYYSAEKAAETLPRWRAAAADFVLLRISPTRITSSSA